MLKLDKQNLNKKTFIQRIVGKRNIFIDISKLNSENSKQISEELKKIDPSIQLTYHSLSSEKSINKTLNKWKELESLNKIIDFNEKDEKGRLFNEKDEKGRLK